MNWKTIFNPFEKFDEKLLLLVGILAVIASIAIGYLTETSFNSIFKIGRLESANLQTVSVLTVVSFAMAIAVLLILGKIFNKKTRIIDIVNTVLISQVFLIMLQALEKLPYNRTARKNVIQYQQAPEGIFPIWDFTIMTMMSLFVITILIYSIILYYNGFKTATNIKKWQHIALFAVISIITTLVCQIITHKLI
ncbi:YIP1 family protein [Chryseobacterium pennipullorum]|uniref:Yip1 domain-containing protein n=1 Tax=Chryseobacterium pennipullorum TaxID=2258963 RepID=A0A3D9B2I3_9FLAO|nr:YIP1 family protein [Chryseobacterium pennipullorum]REC47803.1 hypothetical protein DRF67_10105 [Chryseobacterium pennipullorum]